MKKKVVFCEVAWMKYYNGITDDDKPKNGGKFVTENGEGMEMFNFSPYNHKCYGYVMHYGNELHIERYDKILKSFDEVRDMTVVWVASDGGGCKIVGWYEHATMYRFWQELYDNAYFGDYDKNYNFLANEKDCYLIDATQRTFAIPRAPIAGKGRGMGQSQVWYADSTYAQEEFIPKVMKYLDSVRDSCKPFYILPEELEKRAEDKRQTTKQLLDEAAAKSEKGLVRDAMALINLALDNDDCYDTRFAKANLFGQLGWYDEAEEEYKHALYHEENADGMGWLMHTEMMLKHTFLAIELGEKIRKRKDEDPDWMSDARNLAYLYMDEGELDKAEILMNECEWEKDSSIHEWIADARECLEERKKEMQTQ